MFLSHGLSRSGFVSSSTQSNIMVFKAVCAIANREGGVLYLGVKDDGSVAKGPHFGVRGDREKLHITNNDALSRHINSPETKKSSNAL